MARKRRKQGGFRHIGKEVQNTELRIDKDLYLDRSKATGDNKMNIPLVDGTGKLLVSPAAFALPATLADDNAAVPSAGFGAGKIFTITTTGTRSKALPATGTILSELGLTVFYQFVDIPFINLGSSGTLTISAGDGDTDITGSAIISNGESGLFRFVAHNLAADELKIYRIA
tara:strand:+ start:15 stop:530 length:516 start_codon:yes stop_codon:yes gene_type:complete